MTGAASAPLLADAVRAARERPDTMGPEWIPVLRDVPLFAGLSKRHLQRVANLARPVRFAANATIVRAGARGQSFYVILDGEAKVVRSKGSVRLGPMSFFGEMSLIDGGPRSATVVAQKDTLTMRLARAPFMKLVQSEPAIAVHIMKELVARLRRFETSPTE
jgi:CRP/FNR family transcriptional regulator, cyclic AMP receptor protein